MHAADATIAKIKDAIGTLIKNDEAEATRGLVNVNQLIQNFADQLKTMPSESLQVIAQTRSSDVFRLLYMLLMLKEEEAEVSKAATNVDTRVVTPAEFPMTVAMPKAALTMLTGLFLRLSVGVGLVLARRAVSGRLQSKEEVRRGYAMPLYTMIPRRSRTEATTGIFPAGRRARSPRRCGCCGEFVPVGVGAEVAGRADHLGHQRGWQDNCGGQFG